MTRGFRFDIVLPMVSVRHDFATRFIEEEECVATFSAAQLIKGSDVVLDDPSN